MAQPSPLSVLSGALKIADKFTVQPSPLSVLSGALKIADKFTVTPGRAGSAGRCLVNARKVSVNLYCAKAVTLS